MGDVTAGKAIFDTNCGACHPNGGQGVGPSLAGGMGRLGQSAVTTQIRNGKGSMPPFPTSRISDSQLNDLLAYLNTLR